LAGLGSLVGLNRGDVNLLTRTLNIHLKGDTEGRVFINPGPGRLLGQPLKENAAQGTPAADAPNMPLFKSVHRQTYKYRKLRETFYFCKVLSTGFFHYVIVRISNRFRCANIR